MPKPNYQFEKRKKDLEKKAKKEEKRPQSKHPPGKDPIKTQSSPGLVSSLSS